MRVAGKYCGCKSDTDVEFVGVTLINAGWGRLIEERLEDDVFVYAVVFPKSKAEPLFETASESLSNTFPLLV